MRSAQISHEKKWFINSLYWNCEYIYLLLQPPNDNRTAKTNSHKTTKIDSTHNSLLQEMNFQLAKHCLRCFCAKGNWCLCHCSHGNAKRFIYTILTEQSSGIMWWNIDNGDRNGNAEIMNRNALAQTSKNHIFWNGTSLWAMKGSFVYCQRNKDKLTLLSQWECANWYFS